MSTPNICFGGEIRKNIYSIPFLCKTIKNYPSVSEPTILDI